jgi:hypothetical protein
MQVFNAVIDLNKVKHDCNCHLSGVPQLRIRLELDRGNVLVKVPTTVFALQDVIAWP